MISYEDRKKEIGKRIRQERENLGLRPKEFLPQIYKSETSHKSLLAWEDGERLPDLDSLTRMADLFKCDVGYLLCDYDERHRDTADVKKITGLSEPAIERLKIMWSRIKCDKASGWNGTPVELELKAINTLIESDRGILLNIHNYLFGQYDSFAVQYGERDDQETFEKEVRLCNNGSGDGIFIRANQIQSVFLLEIQRELMELRSLAHGKKSVTKAGLRPQKSRSDTK